MSSSNIIPLNPIKLNREQTRRIKFKKKKGILSLEEFFKLLRCPIQRDESLLTGRAGNKSIQRKFRKLLPEHCEVIAAILECDIKDDETGKVYKKGTVFLIDGHTRRVIWSLEYDENKGKWVDMLPEEVGVTYYYVDSYTQLADLYDHFDNASSAERTADKFYGACHTHGFELSNSKLRQVMAIQYAAHKMYPKVFTSPKGMSVSDFSQVAKRFKNPLMVLDKIGNGKFKNPKKKGNYTLGTTPLITALLMAFKKHDVKLDANGECSHKLFEIANQLNDGYCQQGERMDGVSHIITEWKEDLLIPEKPFNFNTIDKELSFVLYWIEVALDGKKLKEIGNPGNKSWTTYVNRYTSNTYEAINNALNTQMIGE